MRRSKIYLILAALVLMLAGLSSLNIVSADELKAETGLKTEAEVKTKAEMEVKLEFLDDKADMQQLLTREELCVILDRIMKGKADTKSDFADVKGRASEAAIANLTEMKLLKGYPDGSFKPENVVTMQELAAIMYGYFERNIDMAKMEVVELPALKNSFAKEQIEKLHSLGFSLFNDKIEIQKKVALGDFAGVVAEGMKIEAVKNKAILEAYLKSIDMTVLEEKGIKTEKNAKAIAAFVEKYEYAKALVEKKEMTKEEKAEVKALPYKKINDKKIKGEFNKLAKKIHADMEVVAKREVENKDNHKKYPKLADKKIVLKTVHENLGKFGEDDKRYIKLNYISKEQYAAKTEVDSVAGATPKYDKQEFPKDLYKIAKTKEGYVVEISEVPEDVAIIKPIIFIKIANGTYVEYGDMVYVK